MIPKHQMEINQKEQIEIDVAYYVSIAKCKKPEPEGARRQWPGAGDTGRVAIVMLEFVRGTH